MLANLCRSNNKPEDGSTPAPPLSSPLSLALSFSPAQTHLHANSLDLPWCQCVYVSVCVQSKVSNNVSGRMCLAIEIYLHYYSVLTMRLGSSISPLFPSSPPHCLPRVSSNRLRSSLSLLRSLGCPSTRQALSTATRPSLHPEAAFVALASVSVFFALHSSLPSSVCFAVQSSFGLRSSVTCRNCFQASATKIRYEQPEHLQNVNLQQRINSSVK